MVNSQMKSRLLFALVMSCTVEFNQLAVGQTGPTLRQGYALTEKEAKNKLVEMAAKVPDAAAWRLRAKAIRANILRGARLEHLPSPCPLRPIRHSRRELDGYSVENVAFEALPGFFVTGNLYLPLEVKTPMPGVLAPHGHLENKRRHESTQHRSAAMARMGAAVLPGIC